MTGVAAVVRVLIIFLLIALIVILVTRRLAIPYTLGLVVVGLLINDGVAGSLFQTFLVFALLSVEGWTATGFQAWLSGIGAFLLQAGGGAAAGLVGGFLVSHLVKFIDDPLIELASLYIRQHLCH